METALHMFTIEFYYQSLDQKIQLNQDTSLDDYTFLILVFLFVYKITLVDLYPVHLRTIKAF